MAGAGQVKGIPRLARLEENVGILRGAAEDRTVGRQGALAVSFNQVRVDHGTQIVVG